MATDWATDVKVYAPDADDGIIAGVVRYCGIALQKRDSSLISFSDPKELDRVRNNFLKKKLALGHSDDVLDAAIAKVGERMKGDRTKNRVTVYYLLAESYGLLDLFQKKTAAKMPNAVAPKTAPAKEAKAAVAKPKTSAPKKAAGSAAIAGVASLANLGGGARKKATALIEEGAEALSGAAEMAVAASAAAVGASGAAAAAAGDVAGKALHAVGDAAASAADTAGKVSAAAVGAAGAAVAGAVGAAAAAGDKLSGAASDAVHGLIGDGAAEGSASKRWLAWLLLIAILAFVLWWIFFSSAATG